MLKSFSKILLPLATLSAFSSAANAGFVYSHSIEMDDSGLAAGIAYDANSDTIWTVSSNTGDGLRQYSTDGTLLSTLSIADPINGNGFYGFDILSNGNFLFSNSDSAPNSMIYEFTQSGDLVDTGSVLAGGTGVLDVSGLAAADNDSSADPDGLTYDASTNSLWLANDVGSFIYNVDLNGIVLSLFNTEDIHPDFDEPEGIEINPLNGNLFISDDETGTSSVYEVTRDGDLVSRLNLESVLGVEYADAEGLAYNASTHQLYVAINASNDPAGGEFNSRILVLDIVDVPEPGTALLLLLGATGLVVRRQRR